MSATRPFGDIHVGVINQARRVGSGADRPIVDIPVDLTNGLDIYVAVLIA
jgi:hypothetical protein